MNFKAAQLPFCNSPPVQVISKLENLCVPRLSYDLQKVLKIQSQPHFVKDPQSLTYKLDSRLHDISNCLKFDYSKLPKFVKPSNDARLKFVAVENNCKFYASTSSITSILGILQFSWSDWRINTQGFSKSLQAHSDKFVSQFSKIHAIELKYDSNNNVYGIDNGQHESTSILSDLGHSLEKFLTSSPETYSTFLASQSTSSHDVNTVIEDNGLSYHYSKVYGFMLRAQLDCIDPSLPKQTFDLKTRATVALRLTQDVEYSKVYEINKFKGFFQSFEKEDYDLLRSVLLKFGLQSRIGNMDGILVAYHNVFQIFGFQYFSQEKLDSWVYGSTEKALVCFDLSLRILKLVLEEITNKFPKQNIKIYYVNGAAGQIHFVVVPAEKEKVISFIVTAVQKKKDQVIKQSINEWKDLDNMSMEISIQKNTKKFAQDIIRRFELNRIFDSSSTSDYFKRAYNGYLHKLEDDQG